MKRRAVVAVLFLLVGMTRIVPVAAEDVCFEQAATIVGAGTIVGTPDDDVIVGSSGPDEIRGNGGDDIICGGGGDDVVNGNSGNDLIFGETGNDTLAGDEGDDVLFGDNDSGQVRADDHYILGWVGYYPGTFGGCVNKAPGFGDDLLTGGSGRDRLLDVCGNNTADGGSNVDYLDVSGTAKGGDGNDVAVWAYDGVFDNGQYRGLADGEGGNDRQVYVHGGIARGGSGNDGVWAEHDGSEADGGSGSDFVADYSDNPFSSSFHDQTSALSINGGSGWDTCGTAGDDAVFRCEDEP